MVVKIFIASCNHLLLNGSPWSAFPIRLPSDWWAKFTRSRSPAVTSTRCTSLCLQRADSDWQSIWTRNARHRNVCPWIIQDGTGQDGKQSVDRNRLSISVHNECVCVPQRWMDHCLEGVQLILFQGLGLFTNRKGRTTDLMGDNESVILTVDMWH